MNKAQRAGLELKEMDELAMMKSPVHSLSAFSKLFLTLFYILVVVSFHKYDLFGLFTMVLFPIAGYQLSLIPVSTCFRKLRVAIPLVCAVGLLNPFFDSAPVTKVGAFVCSGGVISMITLMMKGIFTLMASFLLAATTPVGEIGHALRQIHCPKMLTTLFMLTYRYVSLLLEEVGVMTEAYHLRAPGQKGIHISAWGSFLGQLLLRTMDRAQEVYESMVLRGFHGEFAYAEGKKKNSGSLWIALMAAALILLFRLVNLPALLSSLLC